tara:strand:+ start:70 stop:609 length:540 start_codon:yes stop_codon:yes gene_type:complete
MAHFAKIRVSDNKVMHVIVVSNSEVDFNGDPKGETWCQTTFKTDPSEYYWKQTSYNTGFGIYRNPDGSPHEDQTKAFRKNFAGRGMYYHTEKDCFFHPKTPTGMNGWEWDEDKGAFLPPAGQPTVKFWTGPGATNTDPGDLIYYKWDDATLGWIGRTDTGDPTQDVEMRWDSATEAWIL